MSEAGDSVVISGISGRFPESDNIEEFKRQLFDCVDMVTDDERRWPAGLYGLPLKTGKLKNLKHLDAYFFGVSDKQAEFMDPQMRLLLEVTYEAIVDAGINPSELRGTNTGVFIGSTYNETFDYLLNDVDTIHGFGFIGTSKLMLANRISFVFDFTGPSYVVDTACSSSLLALQQAYDAIATGVCDAAIVGGANLLLNPRTSLQFQRLGVLNSDGKCKTFDSKADGYVRSEAVVAVLLQKHSDANRIYATVLGAKTNTDGYKKAGIGYPSSDMQKDLFRGVYAQSKLDPSEVVYLEAHGTGTKAGDPQEANAIAEIFCGDKRKAPLMIGSLKSNMGHSEAASGLCSLIKTVIAMESGVIPANLHYHNPNVDIKGLHDGRLKVVSKNEKWNGGLVGVNSFGFGGTNVHVILRSNSKPKASSDKPEIPRLITVSGRTQDSVHYLLDKIKESSYDEEFYALIDNIHKDAITGHNCRGFGFIGHDGFDEVGEITAEKPPVWFVFSGMGSQWSGMGKDLMGLEPFRRSIEHSADLLKPYGIDLINVITNGDDKTLDNVLYSFVSIISIEIALVDTLKLLNIRPDGMIGHSVGEIGCAYADNTITSEQAILLAYSRGLAVIESKLPKGAMAAVGLTREECEKRVPNNIFLACHNASDSVTISGDCGAINKFVEQLSAEGIFAKIINTSGVAFHCKYMKDVGSKLKSALDSIIPKPKRRSEKWISTSIPETDWNTPIAQNSSAAYHVNNLLSPVYFYEATRFIPKNAIVIEIAPHCLLQAVLKRSLASTITLTSMMKKDSPDNIKYFLTNIGKLYKSGGQPNIAALYPKVSFPVSKGTPMISSMIKWDHSIEWSVPNFNSNEGRGGESVINIDLSKEEYRFLIGHKIDNRIMLPATGYLVLVWKTFAHLRNSHFENLPVVFEDVKFLKPTFLPLEGAVKFFVNIFDNTGDFQISVSGVVVAFGRIYTPDNINTEFLNIQFNNNYFSSLNTNDIYKDTKLRGYNYDNYFKGIISSDNDLCNGNLAWKNNWISYMDTMVQFYFFGKTINDLCLPSGIHKLVINPNVLKTLNLDVVPINVNHKYDVVTSGGIEMRSLKGNFVRQLKKYKTPIFEKYVFTPFENSEPSTTDNVLNVILQLVSENNSNAAKINIVSNSDKNILEKLREIAKNTPNCHIESTEKKAAHLVILTGTLTNEIVMASSMLKPGGFILFVEPINDAMKLNSLEIVYKQDTSNNTFILARKPVDVSRNAIIIEVTNDNFNWVDTLKGAMKFSEITGNKIYILSNDELAGVIGLINCLRKEPEGRNIQCLFIQDKNAEAFSFSSSHYVKQLRKDLAVNIFKNGVWGTFRHVFLDIDKGNMREIENAYINTTKIGDLSTLKWIEAPLISNNNNNNKCIVYYAPINLRDVMLATGKLQSEVFFGGKITDEGLLGQEFSGLNFDGKRVMGLVPAGSLATTVVTDQDYLWEVPEKWSLKEAATVPMAYAISYYALIISGNIQPGQTILIHSGAGCVGLASISIALYTGCKIFITVSNQLKRNYLTSRFPQLNPDYIGYSRDGSFEKMIITQTKGRGVDLILTNQQVQRSLRCLATGGKLLEIGKIDTALNISGFSKNTTYHGITLDTLFTLDYNNKIEINRLLNEGIKNGTVQPFPNTIYTEDKVEDAFKFLSSGENIGKVSIKIRDETIKPTHKTVLAVPKLYMDAEKVYVLIGGLGGFGLELTNWLVDRGAKKIVLSSKRGVTSGYQSLRINRWRNNNVFIYIYTNDVTTFQGANDLLIKSKSFGPIGGVFNLAAVLKDAYMINQTEESFKTVCDPKISVTKHLDLSSRNLAPDLDYFVAFSSVSCGFGNPGQGNYGFANSAIERICEKRRADGLHALAIQWGPIGGVGMLENIDVGEWMGFQLQNISSCLSVLENCLQQSHPVLGCRVMPDKGDVVKATDKPKLSKSIARIIGLADPKAIPSTTTLNDIGMDSLMLSELKQALDRDYDLAFSLREIRELTFEKIFTIEKSTTS